MADGRLAPIPEDQTFRCECGKVKDGSKRGPRGGRQWKWVTSVGEYCAKECPKNDGLAQAQEQMRGEWEEQQAMERYA